MRMKGAPVQTGLAAAASVATLTSALPAAANRSRSSRRRGSAVTISGCGRCVAAIAVWTGTLPGWPGGLSRSRSTSGSVDKSGGCGQSPANTNNVLGPRVSQNSRPVAGAKNTRTIRKGHLDTAIAERALRRGSRTTKEDDPRPGGDGGRRGAAPGGSSRPTQRSRGVQPPRACLNVPFETSRTHLQVARQGTGRTKQRRLFISMP
jgi:hypothetical protein